jgi:hypothetical protein
MNYIYLLIGLIDLIVVFLNRDWGFAMSVILGILLLAFGLYDIFMPRQK